MVRFASIAAVLMLLVSVASSAAAAQDAKETNVNRVDPAALDGLCYALTVTPGKGALPPAAKAAGLSGWTLTFAGGKAVISIPNGGEAKCKFNATAVNGIAEVQNAGNGNLARAQALAPTSGYVTVAVAVTGEIADKGKSFSGRITWTEKDDRKNGKAVFTIVGAVPKSN